MSQFRSRTSPWLSGGSRPRPQGHDGHPTGAATGGAGGGGAHPSEDAPPIGTERWGYTVWGEPRHRSEDGDRF